MVLVAGTTAWALVPPPSAHMPVLHLDRPLSFLYFLSQPVSLPQCPVLPLH